MNEVDRTAHTNESRMTCVYGIVVIRGLERSKIHDSHWFLFWQLYTCMRHTSRDLGQSIYVTIRLPAGDWFNLKMPVQEIPLWRCDTILRPSSLHNGISFTGKMTSSDWISLRFIRSMWLVSPWGLVIAWTIMLSCRIGRRIRNTGHRSYFQLTEDAPYVEFRAIHWLFLWNILWVFGWIITEQYLTFLYKNGLNDTKGMEDGACEKWNSILQFHILIPRKQWKK